MRARFYVLAVAVAVALAGCGGARADGAKANVVAVDKKSGAPVGATRPCEEGLGDLVDADHAEGSRIIEVCTTGGSLDGAATVRKVMRLARDKTLTADALRRDLEAAYATGVVDQVEATARRSGSGVVLFLALQERPTITAVAFEGVNALAGDPVVASFPKPGAPLNPSAVHRAAHRLKEEYVRRGWDDATVNHVVARDDGGVRLKVVVTEGALAKVGKVTFEGARGGREVALRKVVELDEGTPLVPERLERSLLFVNAFYYDNGFVNVRVDEPRRARAADGTTTITFPITEGPVFKIRKLGVKNVDAAIEKELLAALKTKPGDVFSRSKLRADMDTIQARMRQKGKTVTAEPETDLDAKTTTIDVVFAIKE